MFLMENLENHFKVINPELTFLFCLFVFFFCFEAEFLCVALPALDLYRP